MGLRFKRAPGDDPGDSVRRGGADRGSGSRRLVPRLDRSAGDAPWFGRLGPQPFRRICRGPVCWSARRRPGDGGRLSPGTRGSAGHRGDRASGGAAGSARVPCSGDAVAKPYLSVLFQSNGQKCSETPRHWGITRHSAKAKAVPVQTYLPLLPQSPMPRPFAKNASVAACGSK